MNPKRFVLILAALSGLNLAAHEENPKDFTVTAPVGGAKFTLSQAKGKIVALHFLLKTECPFCLKHTHDYAALTATKPEVLHIFLKPDNAAEIKNWTEHISKDGLKELPVIYRDEGERLAKAFAVPDGYKFHGQTVHFPALVVLDGTGKELFRYVGESNADRMSTADFTAKLGATK